MKYRCNTGKHSYQDFMTLFQTQWLLLRGSRVYSMGQKLNVLYRQLLVGNGGKL